MFLIAQFTTVPNWKLSKGLSKKRLWPVHVTGFYTVLERNDPALPATTGTQTQKGEHPAGRLSPRWRALGWSVTFGEEGLVFTRDPVERSLVRGMNVLFPALGVFVLRK